MKIERGRLKRRCLSWCFGAIEPAFYWQQKEVLGRINYTDYCLNPKTRISHGTSEINGLSSKLATRTTRSTRTCNLCELWVVPRREASEPLGNESAMNVFSISLRDNSTNKKANRHSFYRDRHPFNFRKHLKTGQLSNLPCKDKKRTPAQNTPLTKMSALQVVRTSFLGPRPFFYPPNPDSEIWLRFTTKTKRRFADPR